MGSLTGLLRAHSVFTMTVRNFWAFFRHLIPPYFLTGHLILSKEAVLHYKFSYKGSYPDVKDQISMKWNDPIINIAWPKLKPILSNRDK